MVSNEQELDRYLRNGFRLIIEEDIVENAFPHMDRPSSNEMEIAIDSLLNDRLVPQDIEAKISYKPTWEMLNEFCRVRGLAWEKDLENNYHFRINRFYSSK